MNELPVFLPQSFAAPQDWQRSRRTLGVLVAILMLLPLGFVTGLLHPFGMHAEPKDPNVQHVFLVVTLLLPLTATWLLLLCWKGAERLRFEVTRDSLVVHTLFRHYTLPLAGAHAGVSPNRLTLRLAGTGLPGLYTGFYLLGNTRVRVWATQRQGGVLVQGEKRWFVTPHDVSGFLRALHAAGVQMDGTTPGTLPLKV